MLCGQAVAAITHSSTTKAAITKVMIMSTQSGHFYIPHAPIGAEAVAAPTKPGWLKAIERVRDKLHRHRQLQSLVELDNRLLADVGITRKQALNAAKNGCWIRSAICRGPERSLTYLGGSALKRLR